MTSISGRFITTASVAALLATAAFVLTCGKPSVKVAHSDEPPPPNILVLVADDAGWRDFGAYGNDAVRTPNIDKLAAEGLLVKHAFVTSPQCSPSRISILTGQYPHSTGAEDLHMPLPDGKAILPGLLQKRDYFTGHMLKTHYGPNADEQFNWYSKNLGDFSKFLDESKGRPFFMWVGFEDPHRPYDPPAIGKPHDPATVKVPPFLEDTPETRQDLANYYDEITRMDARIGSYMEELERRGLERNTLIVFLSDNGAPFPREKGTLYDAGIRTPLIFTWPDRIKAGTTYDKGLVSLVDLAPTLLDIAGLEAPEDTEGKSIAKILTDQNAKAREAVFAERNWHDTDEHMRSIRTQRYKLIRNAYIELPHGSPEDIASSPSWRVLFELKKQGKLTPEQARLFEVPRPRIELYDLERDPWETKNLAGTNEYAETAQELARALDAWIHETNDFSPWVRRRDDHTDRITGVWFSGEIPPMRNVE